MLSVAASARGRGVGEALVRRWSTGLGPPGSAAWCSPPRRRWLAAHRLYERLGFTRLPERDWTPLPGLTLVAYAYGLPL